MDYPKGWKTPYHSRKNRERKNSVMAKAKSLEASLGELETVLKELEKEELSLEDSFRLYNEGMKLLKSCNDMIDKVEKKLVVLNEEN
jgi:exodeoxyribonuclease VII small subunit